MDSSMILWIFAVVACICLLSLALLAERITTGAPLGDDGELMADHIAHAGDMIGDMIEVGGALFTAEEFARLVDLSIAYHSAPTTGGDR